MDKELIKLEAELAALPLNEPSSRLREEIAGQLNGHEDSKGSPTVTWLQWALPLAAALIIAVVWPRDVVVNSPALSPHRESMNEAHFKPVASQEILYASHDDGVVQLADGRLARQERRAYLDQVVWRNPETNASLTWSVPRDEVRVTPLSFQ